VPAFGNRTVLKITQDVGVLLNLEIGLTWGKASKREATDTTRLSDPQPQGLEHVDRQSARRKQENTEFRTKLAVTTKSGESGGIPPENLVWIFGSGRSGSTWLGSMMGDLEGCATWDEPLLGKLFADLYYSKVANLNADNEHFIFAAQHKEAWIDSVRMFVLRGADARFPQVTKSGYLAIKEPNGSTGAPLLMEALPESRMITLIRDPRDVIASFVDADREGGWLHEHRGESLKGKKARDPHAFVRNRANYYLQSVGKAKQAYEAHEGHKILVKYEDLRADTLNTMQRIYSMLNIHVDEAELAQVIEKHSWENIPEEKKGTGKFYRKAIPKGWREDLTPQQVKMVEQITAPLLEELYPN